MDARTRFLDEFWDQKILPALSDYVAIPAKSPGFDPDWRGNGQLDRAVEMLSQWVRDQNIDGLALETVRIEDRTPVLFGELEGDGSGTVLFYAHYDKQPEVTGWRDGLGPWTPKIEGGRLFGRGAADDGYALFAYVAALRALGEEGRPLPSVRILIEGSEESGSFDLPAYVEALADRIGTPDLVVVLDSGCGNYDQLWVTTSLRGVIGGRLKVEVLEHGVHSGDASGVVPSSFRILRSLLSRIEDPDTGEIGDPAFNTPIPDERVAQARDAAGVLGDGIFTKFPWQGTTVPVCEDLTEMLLNKTWRPQLGVTGAEGLPAMADAGNVLRPFTTARLSLRLPPTCLAPAAADRLKTLLETDPPHGAGVGFTVSEADQGWNAPPMALWLEQAVQSSSMQYFNRPPMYIGEGGSIPFIAMLGKRYPDAQFLITGVLGPGSNAHGPNEFLHLATARAVTGCVVRALENLAGR